MGSSRWDVVVGLKYSKWSLANQTSVVLFLDCRQFCMEKNIWVSRLARIATRAQHMYLSRPLARTVGSSTAVRIMYQKLGDISLSTAIFTGTHRISSELRS